MTDLPRPASPSPSTLAELALAAQYAVAGGAAHEMKNALNGVAVNLAVVQSRLQRQQAPETVTRFVDAASSQLELLTRQVEALLAIVREPHGAIDLGALVRQLALLAGRRASGDAAFVVIDAGAVPAAVDPVAVRALAALALAPALSQDGTGECTVAAGPDGAVELCVRAAAPLAFDPRGEQLARLLGVAVARTDHDELVLTFPAAHDLRKL